METYHALTPVAPPKAPIEDGDHHPLAPVKPTTGEPEPSVADEQPAAIVNHTLEELARGRATHAGARSDH